MRDRIEKSIDLNMIIDTDARPLPRGELPVSFRQGTQRIALDLFEQLSAADPEFAHRLAVHCLDGVRDGRVAFGEREEGLPSRASQNIGLRKSPASTFALSRGLLGCGGCTPTP